MIKSTSPCLGIFTNKPAFTVPLHVGISLVEPELKLAFMQKLETVFEDNYFTNNGPLVQKLEDEVAVIHGYKYGIAVCNATVGLLLVLKVSDLKNEVILPSFTSPATVHAVLWQGLKPVFCDIDPKNLMLSSKDVERLLNPEVSAILGVDIFGNLSPIDELVTLAQGRPVIIDAAHSFACKKESKHKPAIEVLSFHATKIFSTFEGGMILTDDEDVMRELRYMRNYGFQDYDDIKTLGINAKLNEVSAAMGLASLDFMEERIEKLRRTRELYIEYLSPIEGLHVIDINQGTTSNYHYFSFLVDKDKFGIDRNLLLKVLRGENIMAKRYFYPGCHKMKLHKPFYRDLPNTDLVSEKVICLPTGLPYPEMDVAKICKILQLCSEHGRKISEWDRV
ncbi:MAG: DegT/DnrJ/EryC1/StrS family aminotransferase [Arenicellaceae bacterium]|nr:DegT/DnrJ/EryC1/StrS family aminotransferase [Arenicellaceae bacterium]